jgi:aminopeptidase C
LAKAQYEFIKDIAFTDDEGTKARLIEFDLQRPTETPGGFKMIDTKVRAPFLGLVTYALI